MAKSKNESNGAVIDAPAPTVQQPMLRINFDDLDAIETIESEPTQEPAPGDAVAVDSEENILATVESFDSAFANDPLAAKYREFGNTARAYADPSDATPRYVGLGSMLHDIEVAEHNLAPSSYDRAKVMKKCETALRVCGVPESMVRPQELTGVFWTVKLDRSTPPASEGEPRTFSVDATPAEWFGGNITTGALRVLAKSISRVSKNDELDVWEYRDGYETWARDMVNRLRRGELSIRQVERLLDARKKNLADAKKRERFAGLTPDEINSVEAAEKNASLQSRLNELGQKALDVQKFAADELKKGGAELKEFLANRGVIPAEKFITPQEYAAQMTPGDAKALVQELIKLYATKPDRLPVFKTLYATCKSVVDQMKAAQESQPAKKAG
jgi:hypothetical protein